MKHYLKPIDAVLEQVNSQATGLSSQEAADRLARDGKNKLAEAEKATLLQRFIAQLKDPMLIILMAAALVSGITSLIAGESFTDVIIIMVVVLLNAILGVYQESKADKAIEALQTMSAAVSNVLRDGQVRQIPSEDLVVGDVVLVEAGTAVPADCRIIENASLQVEEAALTGESVPVNKDADQRKGTMCPWATGKTCAIWAPPWCMAGAGRWWWPAAWTPRWAKSPTPSPKPWRADPPSDQAGPAEQNSQLPGAGHLRLHLCCSP